MSDFLVTFFVDNRAFSQLLSDVLKNKHQALFNETLGLPSDFIIPFSQEEKRGSVIYTIKANLCGDYDITLMGSRAAVVSYIVEITFLSLIRIKEKL